MNGQVNRSGAHVLDETMLGVQRDVLDHVTRAIGARWLTPERYVDWLQAERVLLEASYQGIDAALRAGHGDFGCTHRAWLMTHYNVLRVDAALVASDLRALGATAGAETSMASRWRWACIDAQRASPWRLLGASLLPREHLAGPASEALAAMLALPGLAGRGTGFLRRRRQLVDASRFRSAEMAVGLTLDAHIWQELAAGLRSGAHLHGQLLLQLLQPPSPASRPSMRRPATC